ncbi:unnamed protein product [Auanema sp. JU1783]|nr:unnamed protein product [Auanema sp. JU1783]
MDLLSDANNLAAVQQLLRTNPLWASSYLTNMSPFMVGQQLSSSALSSTVPTTTSTTSSETIPSSLPQLLLTGSSTTASPMSSLPFLLPASSLSTSSGLLTTAQVPSTEKSE